MRDAQGLELTGTPGSAESFDRAIADYYALGGDPVGKLKAALARDPGFALGATAIAALVSRRRLPAGSCRGQGGAEGGARRDAARQRRANGCIWRPSRPGRRAGCATRPRSGRRSSSIIRPTRWRCGSAQDAYFFLGAAAAMRDCVARVLPGMARRRSPDQLRPRPARLRPGGDRRLRRRRALRARGARPQPRRRLGRPCARACVRDDGAAGGGRRLPRRVAPGLARRAFHGRPQRLAPGALSDRTRPLRRSARGLRPPHAAEAARTTRRSTASTPPRCCGGWSSKASTSARAGRPCASNGRRTCTTTCSPSTICISPSPSPATRASRRCSASRSTPTRAKGEGDTAAVMAGVGRPLIEADARFRAGGLCRERSSTFCRCATTSGGSAAAMRSATSSTSR